MVHLFRASPSLAAFLLLLLSLVFARSIADGALVVPPERSPVATAELHTVVAPAPAAWLIAGTHVASHPTRGAVPSVVRWPLEDAPCPPSYSDTVPADAPFALADFLAMLDATPSLLVGIWPEPATEDDASAHAPRGALVVTDAPIESDPPPTAPAATPLARPQPRDLRVASPTAIARAIGATTAPAASAALRSSVSFEFVVQALAFGTLALVLLVPFLCAGLAPRLSA